MTEWDNSCDFGAPTSFVCGLCGHVFLKKWHLEIHEMTVAGSRWCR